MAFFEGERRRFVVRKISRGTAKDSDGVLGREAADAFFERVQDNPSAASLVERLNGQSEEVWEFVATMSSYLLSRDRSRAYLRSREQRLYVAEVLQDLGLRGKDLGQTMSEINTLAVGNARSRR